MIDDAVLESLVREAADAVEVPPDGPSRVLAARDRLLTRRHRVPALADRLHAGAGWIRRRPSRTALAALASVVIVAALAGALAGLSSSTSSPRSSSAARLPHFSTGPAANPLTHGAAESGGAPGVPASSPPAGGTSPNQVPPGPSQVIKTGSLTLQVRPGQVDAVTGQLTSITVGLNGFVANTTSSSTSGQPATAQITLRVPSSSFETLLGRLPPLGTVTQETIGGQDVSSQYVDLNARLQSLQDARTQFQQILTRAQSISDILAVEQQITNLQTQIEQIQGQLRVLDDQTTYGTLTVDVVDKAGAAAPPSGGITKSWHHALHSFAAGFDSVVAALGGIAIFLVCALVLGALGWLGWNVVRRRLV